MATSSTVEQLSELLEGRLVIVGIGNDMLGDDGAGPRVVELLQKTDAKHLYLIDAGSAPERHFGEIESAAPDAVILIDAVDMGAACGEVAFFTEENLPARVSQTHDVSLRLVMQFLRMTTKAKVGLIGIQPSQLHFGAGLSAPVEEAAQRLARIIAAGEVCAVTR